MSPVNVVIVGGGIAGMRVARQLAREGHTNIHVFERDPTHWGGRLWTVYRPNNVQYEAGAGRFHNGHVLLQEMLREYQLEVLPLPHKSLHMPSQGSAHTTTVKRDMLTACTLPCSTSKKIKHEFPEHLALLENVQQQVGYDAEFEVSHAKECQQSLCQDLGSDKRTYYILKAGYSALIQRMKSECEAKGVAFHSGHALTGVRQQGREMVATFQTGKGRVSYTGRALVVCIPPLDACKVDGVPKWWCRSVLHHLEPAPLMRIYATWKRPWWKAMGVATKMSVHRKKKGAEHIQFFIPITNTLAMASYSDGNGAEFWRALAADPAKLRRTLVQELRACFEEHVPEPDQIFSHYWRQGVYMFRPTRDPLPSQKLWLRPEADTPLYFANEAYASTHQWAESALRCADEVVEMMSL